MYMLSLEIFTEEQRKQQASLIFLSFRKPSWKHHPGLTGSTSFFPAHSTTYTHKWMCTYNSFWEIVSNNHIALQFSFYTKTWWTSHQRCNNSFYEISYPFGWNSIICLYYSRHGHKPNGPPKCFLCPPIKQYFNRHPHSYICEILFL